MPRIIKAHNQGKLRIIGTGNNVVNLTSISNMVEAVRLSIETPHYNEDYNITNDESVKLWDSINTTLQLINKEPITKKVPLRIAIAFANILELMARLLNKNKEPVLTKYTVDLLSKSTTFDITKAKELLGYKVNQSTQDALVEFAEWYLKENS